MIKFLVIGFIIISIMLVIIVIQSLLNFFEQYKKIIYIRSFHGYKSFHNYEECLQIITVSLMAILIISIILNKASLSIILGVTLAGFVLECLLSIIFLNLVTKKKFTKVMKGES
ncbi:DUF1430 domain-containing protein [Clostridium tepidum]|nr:DUF1430 domain-containing protein [Clostridium tepidum]